MSVIRGLARRLADGRLLGGRRGVALMLVLWVIIVLGAVAVGVVSASRAQTDLVGTVRSRTVARYAAESGVAAASALLKEMYGAAGTEEDRARVFTEYQSEIDGWGVRALGSARYQVAVLDLNSRIDLNMSDAELLLGLFRQFVDESKATALLDALEDWTDEDDEPLPEGAEAADYARAGSPYRPTNQPLMRLDELAWIQGFDSIAEVLAPYVTVWGDGLLNVNTADVPVLAAFPELGEGGADLIVSARERRGALDNNAMIWTALVQGSLRPSSIPSQLTTVPSRILVIARGWENDRPLTHEIQAVYEVQVSGFVRGLVLRLRYWVERDV